MVQILEKDFKLVVSEIKKDIKNTQIKTMLQANSELMFLYFRIGKVLNENSKYGNSFIKNVAMEIKLDNPDIAGFSERNLKRMKRFYNEYKEYEKMPQAVAQIPWGHNIVLFEKIKNKNIRLFYAESIIKNGWSRSVLEFQIETNYHLRIGNSTNNFSTSLPPHDSDLVNNAIKDPYIFDFITLKQNYKEKRIRESNVRKN